MVININPLSSKSVEDAIRKIEEYQNSLEYKVQRFMQELYGVAVAEIDRRVSMAKGDSDKSYTPDHEVSVSGTTSEMIIKVKGKDLVFIEFGAGRYYNGGPGIVGDSPHPLGMELGFWIGSWKAQPDYPRKYSAGQFDWWHTPYGISYGTESTAPVYSAAQVIRERAGEIATRVFGENEWEWG